ncbi:MAG TPA: HD domain-containing protein [Myxococcales bacterium]
MHAHVLRTYSWARLLGEASGLQPNDELLFVACILHDLGLTERYAPEPGECFAFAGARHARKLLLAEGLPPAWAARVADAITLHLEVHVSLRQGVEPKLLRDGAAFDVLGIGGRSITREAKRAVLRAYSREGLGAPLAERLRAAARDAPDSRMAFYCRRIDFAGRAARVRLPEEDAR